MNFKAILSSLALGAAVAMPATAAAQESTKIKFILNWKYEGPQAYFFLAEDKGWFAEHGLEVTFDQGSGSAAAVTQVAGGAYDAGFGDVNAVIQFKAENPTFGMKAVQMHYYVPPFVLVSLKDKGIEKPQDLEDKTLGASANDAAFKLFPAFVKASGIDATNIEWQHMDSGLRQQMLVRGDVDAVAGYYITVRFGLQTMGQDPDGANYMFYSDYGLDPYSNAIIFSEKLLTEKPEAVRGFLCALKKAVYYVRDNIEEGVEAVLKREPLLKNELEIDKTRQTYDSLIFSPEVERVGFGNVDEDRLQRSIQVAVDTYDIKTPPSPDQIFTSEFSPGSSECLP
jgi:NitT/TauT family transport system substrate-binding protein